MYEAIFCCDVFVALAGVEVTGVLLEQTETDDPGLLVVPVTVSSLEQGTGLGLVSKEPSTVQCTE